MFEGVDSMGWLARAEKFFEVQNVSAREKIAASIHQHGGQC